MSKKKVVRVYHYYNLNNNMYGEPFTLCDKHHKKQPEIAGNAILMKIADKSMSSCDECNYR